MRKITIAIVLALLGTLIGTYAQAQNGLENIVVEKYYISNAADATGSTANGGGTLPAGSVTYRIYADLLPGYKFQATYGVAGHALVVNTSTTFFNNEDRGSSQPNWTKTQAADNSVMLDSYFTVGGATNVSGGQLGVLKTEDNGVANIVNANGILANNNVAAGIPLTTQDGFITGTVPTITFVGLTTELDVFDATSQFGNSFTTSNGSIACLLGSQGATATNRVLIGQFTTDGIFHYELNIQTISPTNVVQNFVASSPTGNEISISSLTGTLGATPATEPTIVGNITFGTTTSTSIIANFTSGNGAKRLVVVKAGSAVNTNPTDATTYVANATFGLGTQIGTGNYVIANSAVNTVTLTGLVAGTTYYFAVYEYNDNNQVGAENYKTSGNVTGSKQTLSVGTSYQWSQTGSGPYNFSTAANWTPSRTTPASNDILIFGNGANGTIINGITAQTVGQILVQNNTWVKLQGLSSTTLTIAGNTSVDDLRVDAGSVLEFTGFTPVSILIANSATANIYGAIKTSSENTIKATNANGIRFKSGSAFTASTGISNAPFGTAGTTAGSVVFESGSTFNQNSGTLANPFQLTAPASIVTFQAGSNQVFTTSAGLDVDGRTYANLTINAAVTVSSLTGTLNITNLTVGASGSLAIAGTGTSTVNISGDVANNAALALSIATGTGGINFTKVGTQYIGGVGAISLLATSPGNTKVSTGSILSVSKNISVNNIQLNGNYKFAAANLKLTINGAVSGAAQFVPFGTYDASLDFQTSAAGTIGTFNIYNSSLRNLTINRTGTFSLTSTLKIYGVYTPTLGTLITNNNLTIASTTAVTGQIAPTSNLVAFVGDVNIQRQMIYTPYQHIHYVSSPINNANTIFQNYGDDISVVGSPLNYVYVGPAPAPQATVYPSTWWYDNSLPSTNEQYKWVNGYAKLTNGGVGFGLLSNPNTLIDVAGTPENNPVTTAINTAASSNFNLIGNPYPSTIDLNNFFADNTTQIQPAAYYDSYGTTVTYSAGITTPSGFGNGRYCGHSSAIWVNALSGATAVNWSNNQRTTVDGFGNVTSGIFFEDDANANAFRIKISNVSNTSSLDETVITNNANATDGFDNIDVAKLMLSMNNNPSIYTLVDGKNIAINAMPDFNFESKEIAVGVVTPYSGNWTIGVNQSELFSNKVSDIYLEDRSTTPSTFYNLKETPSVTFSLPKGNVGNRFYLNFNKSNVASVVKNIAANNATNVYMVNATLFVNIPKSNTASTIEVTNTMGQQIMSVSTSSYAGIKEFNMSNQVSGNYIVRVVNGNEVSTTKVFLNNNK